MVSGKIQSNLNTSMTNMYRDQKHIEDAGHLGSPLGSPVGQSIPIQATITDTLRSKQSTKTYLHSLKPDFLNPFLPRKLWLQFVLSNTRITLNFDLLQRKTDRQVSVRHVLFFSNMRTQVDQSICRNLKRPAGFGDFRVGSRRFSPLPTRFWLVLCRRISVGCFRTIPVIFQSVSSRTFLEPIGTDRNSPVLSGQESGGKETARKEVIPAGSGDGWMTWVYR